MGLKIKSPSTLYLGSLTKPSISNASGLTVHSLSTVYLGSAVDPESGGETKTLNLVSVGGATYDEDYIFTKTPSDILDMYFETPNDIFSSINATSDDEVEIKLKIKFTNSYNAPIGTDRNYGFGLYVNSTYKIGLVLQGVIPNTKDISANQWYWFKITKRKEGISTYFSFLYSENGIDYTYITNNEDRSNVGNNNKLIFGKGTSTGTVYGFQGSIDFKECDIIINGQSVLWI